MEANSINLPSADLVESEAEQESDDSEETEQGGEGGLPLAAALLASFTILDRELDELAFVLTLEKLELEVVVNIPPPHPSSGPSLWLGLARPPPIELQITAGGASPRLTQLLNKGMPMLRSAILTRWSKFCLFLLILLLIQGESLDADQAGDAPHEGGVAAQVRLRLQSQ